MSYQRSFSSHNNSFSTLINFITPELDWNPFTLLYRETWVPCYPAAQKYVNELSFNRSLFKTDHDYEWTTMIKENAINVDYSANRTTFGFCQIGYLPMAITWTLKECWRKTIWSKRRRYGSRINRLVHLGSHAYEWHGDYRMDIESLCYLTFLLFHEYVDAQKKERLAQFVGRAVPLEFQKVRKVDVYLIQDEIDDLEFRFIVRLLKKLVYNEVGSQIYFSMVNYTMTIVDLKGNSTVIRHSYEAGAEDKGFEISFILKKKNGGPLALDSNIQKIN